MNNFKGDRAGDLLRMPRIKNAFGCCRATIYNWIKDGLFTPPVRVGKRISGWPEKEVNAIVAARILGKSDDVVRAIVCQLIQDRKMEQEAAYV